MVAYLRSLAPPDIPDALKLEAGQQRAKVIGHAYSCSRCRKKIGFVVDTPQGEAWVYRQPDADDEADIKAGAFRELPGRVLFMSEICVIPVGTATEFPAWCERHGGTTIRLRRDQIPRGTR
jgi:hypothetical protein